MYYVYISCLSVQALQLTEMKALAPLNKPDFYVNPHRYFSEQTAKEKKLSESTVNQIQTKSTKLYHNDICKSNIFIIISLIIITKVRKASILDCSTLTAGGLKLTSKID